jgi:hypothetical protein
MTGIQRFCDSFLEACWLAAVILSAFFMNIYTQRMFEPDKASIIRSIAILMLITLVIKILETPKRKTEPTDGGRKFSFASIDNSIFIPAALFFFSYFISSAFSILPHNSFWGSYDRMQGLYTTASYFVIFIIAAIQIKSINQINRLINTVIWISVPVMLYGLLQKAHLDPVPWQSMDPSARISSTMGNPIFMAAYLILIVPLVLGKISFLIASREKSVEMPFLYKVKMAFYAAILILDILCIILTQSRGPLLGMIVGFVAFGIGYGVIYNKRQFLMFSGIIMVFSIVFLVVLNIPKTPLEPLKKIPIIERLSKVNPREGSARVRMILWDTAYKMMRDTVKPPKEADPYNYSKPWRFVLGYGPETIGNTFYRYHSPELVGFEGATVHADNCHDSVINIWVTQGILGVIAFLSLIAGVIWVGFKIIRITRDRRLQFTTLGVVCLLISHFAESLFGIQIVVTLTHFWLFIAVIYVLSKLAKVIPAGELNADKEAKKQIASRQIKAQPKHDSLGSFLLKSLFWTYAGVTAVAILMIISFDWPNMETNVVAWVVGIYFYIIFGIILGTVSLMIANRRHESVKIQSVFKGSSFNLLPYLAFFILAGWVIYISNLNPILADGFYKFAFSADSEITKNYMGRYQYNGEVYRNMYRYQQSGRTLNTDQQKQMAEAKNEYTKWVNQTLYLRVLSAMNLQQSMNRAPMEPTYFNGAGRNYMEQARVLQMITEDNLVPRKPNHLAKTPTVAEIIKFTREDYSKFTPQDFMQCCLSVIKRAYDIEPTNFERLVAMGRVHQYLGTLNPGEIKKHYEIAMEFYKAAQRVAPQHPTATTHVKEMGAMVNNLPK